MIWSEEAWNRYLQISKRFIGTSASGEGVYMWLNYPLKNQVLLLNKITAKETILDLSEKEINEIMFGKTPWQDLPFLKSAFE